MKYLSDIMTCVLFTIAGALFIVVLAYAMPDYPTVYTSWSTKECKAIRLSDGTPVSCKRLKEFKKYENVWVE